LGRTTCELFEKAKKEQLHGISNDDKASVKSSP
jgi:hypothetical protein